MADDDMIEDYLVSLAERNCTEATIDSYRRYLRLADSRLPFGLDVANEKEIRSYLWRKGLTPGSRRTYRSAMNSFYRWAVTMGELDFNPMGRIPSMKVSRGFPRTADDHHVQWLLAEAADPYRLWGILAGYAGIRCIEVSRLHREHVTEKVLTVHRGKGDKARAVPTHPLVWDAVKELPPGPVTDLSPNEVSKKFWRYCVSNKMLGLSMHRLRGWWCSNGYDVTKDIVAMQRGMGHENPRETVGYIKLLGDSVRTAVIGLPTFGWDAETWGPPFGP